MVLSKMYCSEQIVIPEKISNLLKTYAKGKKNAFFIFGFFPLLPVKTIGGKIKVLMRGHKKCIKSRN